jgi:hypothetical protein
MYQAMSIRLSVDFLAEILQARRKCKDIQITERKDPSSHDFYT